MNIYVLVLGLVLLSLLVSVYVFRDIRRSRREKIFETGLIWILPLLGPVLSMCCCCRDPQREKDLREIEDRFRSMM